MSATLILTLSSLFPQPFIVNFKSVFFNHGSILAIRTMPLPAISLRRSSMPSGISVIKLLFIMALRIIGQLFNISPTTSQPDSLWTFPNFLKGYFVPCGVTTLFLRLLSNGWSYVETKQKVISTNESHISDNNENASNESKSINDNVVINVLSNNDPTQNSTKKGEITEYVGESILSGRSANEMELALESQRRSHHDSSEDTGDSDHFAAPVKVSPILPKRGLLWLYLQANLGLSQLWSMVRISVTAVVNHPLDVCHLLVIPPQVASTI